MITAELEREIALKELQLENYTGLKTEFDIKKEEDLLYMLRHLKPIALERYSPEPVVERVAPFELPGVTTDWDFANTSWALDSSTYVSAPSSLKFTNTNIALLKQSAAGQAITNGRVESYVRFYTMYIYKPSYLNAIIAFRANASDGSASPSTTYFIVFDNPYANPTPYAAVTDLYLYSSGSYTLIGQKGNSPSLDTRNWNKIRVTWWVSQGVLVVRVEYYNGTSWSQLCDDFTDNSNTGASSTVNRVGVGPGWFQTSMWHDDTVIYVAV